MVPDVGFIIAFRITMPVMDENTTQMTTKRHQKLFTQIPKGIIHSPIRLTTCKEAPCN